MKTLFTKRNVFFFAAALIVLLIAFLSFRILRTDPFNTGTPLTANDSESGRIILLDKEFVTQPLSDGWAHRTFFNVTPTVYSIQMNDERRSLHCRTDNSGSILARNMQVNLEEFPILNWEWKIEKPLTGVIDEQSSAGDDHPARLFLRFSNNTGATKSAEIIWSNTRFKPGDYKIIDGFYHLVANGLNENAGVWHQEVVDLEKLYQKISNGNNNDKPILTVLGFFCDSDNTGGSSSAYFHNVGLQTR